MPAFLVISSNIVSGVMFRRGDIFDRRTHESGTEVKAITYSAMQINETKDDAELFVIVDI